MSPTFFTFGNPHRQLVPIGPISGVEVTTAYCLERLQQRWPTTAGMRTAGELVRKLEKMLELSVPVRLKHDRALNKLERHKFKAAEYRAFLNGHPQSRYKEIPTNAWILVIHNGTRLVTVHQNNTQEWEFMMD